MRPSDLPPADHWPHGNRSRYIQGCRCELCRKANTEYENQRARARARGDWNGLVDASEARSHILMLSEKGVGTRTIMDAAGVARTVLQEIKTGRKKRIRARTAKKILEVDETALPDSALVPAGPSWELINQMLSEGYTKTRIAKELGSKSKTPSLQLRRDFITARTAAKVARVWRKLMT